jgi:hypothetical protein
VFIHGLGGHPERTWTYSEKSRSKSKVVSVFWPRDLLNKDFPNVRVLTYGYDSHVSRFFSATNQSGIFAHGKKFLLALKRKRKESPKRPLIFLAHSLGGIITKDACYFPKLSIHQLKCGCRHYARLMSRKIRRRKQFCPQHTPLFSLARHIEEVNMPVSHRL